VRKNPEKVRIDAGDIQDGHRAAPLVTRSAAGEDRDARRRFRRHRREGGSRPEGVQPFACSREAQEMAPLGCRRLNPLDAAAQVPGCKSTFVALRRALQVGRCEAGFERHGGKPRDRASGLTGRTPVAHRPRVPGSAASQCDRQACPHGCAGSYERVARKHDQWPPSRYPEKGHATTTKRFSQSYQLLDRSSAQCSIQNSTV
jgi:hypothetical protein